MTTLHGVLVTFRRPGELAEMLRRLAEQDHALERLVVVDNDPSEAAAALVAPHGEYIPAPENLGPAGGIAVGMLRLLEAASDGDWIVTLDDDDPPSGPHALGALAAFAEHMAARDPAVGAVGQVGARFDARRGRLVRVRDEELTGPVAVDYIGGNAFPVYAVAAVRALGPFRDDLFFGFDDLEYGLRLRAAGYALYADGDAWRGLRAQAGRLDLDVRPDRRLAQARWRRYYSLRNLVWMLRAQHRPAAALRVSLVTGLGKPLSNLARDPAAAVAHLRLNGLALRDAWAGRLGRTMEPM